MSKQTDRSGEPTVRPHVVGIGASAGGLEALERFFDHVPSASGMAYVVVQHLSPDFKSLMDELLARHTDLPIRLVEDGVAVEPDHVYLIPPGKGMIISGGRLLLRDRERTHELALPIDVFFRSLARDCGDRAIAVVLSGGGSDGSRGIRDVHEAGGLVVVQSPESAQFDGMPRAAFDTGVAAFVLPPEEIAPVLAEHAKGAGPRPRTNNTPSPGGLDAVYRMLQDEFGIDFTHYKPSTVTRRIERRLQLSRVDDIGGYVERLRRGRDELDTLYRDLLIGVTRFFRNDEAFTILQRDVLPDMIAQGPRDVPFRVWIAGCATGEEAYSLAMILAELSARHGGRPIKIFATDVHPGSIEIAARATYSSEAIANVSPERVARWFQPRGAGYQLVPDIRQMVVFAAHNVIRDAPFTRMDLISCRNMLIYLQPPVQQKVLALFQFSLNRGGVVFLGPSESPGALASDFEPVDRHWRIYRKLGDARTLTTDSALHASRAASRFSPRSPSAPQARYNIAGLLSTYDTLLDEVMPPSLIVTEEGELVHSIAGASRFLELRDGRQDLDVRDVTDGELRMVVVAGLQRAKRESTPVIFKGVRIRTGDDEGVHDVTVRRVRGRNAAAPHVLITIVKTDAAPRPSTPAGTEVELDTLSRERMAALERELSYTKENLQAAVEELETGNEELQAANEELLASNEELQSTNEELQSVNEELYTVNAEYQRKITELTELTNDMDNLLSSTDVGTLFLDRHLRVRKFTPQVAESFTLLPQDVGRSIESFTHRLEYPGLLEDLRKVVAGEPAIEREIPTQSGKTYYLRMLPYRANGSVEGVVLTMIDISGMKAAEDALFHERYLLNSLLASVPDAIYFRDGSKRFIRANRGMSARLGLTDPREVEGKTALELLDPPAALALDRADETVLRTGQAQSYQLEERRVREGTRWDLATRLPLVDREGRVVGVVGVLLDVTSQKRAEERILEAVRRRDEFLAMLSHELRNPLGAIVTTAAILRSLDVDAERRPRLVQVIERQAQQMARLLDDLLEVGRVTQNKIDLRKHPVDLRTVVRDAADAVRTLMEVREHELIVAVTDEPIYVEGDPARLQQIQVNILHNAAKYTPPGGHVRLEVRAEAGEAVITVTDDGEGIPREMLEQVFELFVQSERTLDRAAGGLGVGLTLVRSLVAMHGGTVVARSAGAGRGTEIEVRLPMIPPPADQQVPAEPRVERLPRGTRVAIVEDNADSREMLCELLTLAGFDCTSAAHGEEGLALIRETRPDIALVDVGLPGIDGFEIARRIRAEPALSGVFLVALTGYGRDPDRARTAEAGFDTHLVKPVDVERLIEVMRTAREDARLRGVAS